MSARQRPAQLAVRSVQAWPQVPADPQGRPGHERQPGWRVLPGNDALANLNLQLYFNPCRPTSRGHIEIASKNPRDAALIDPNYLSTQKDIDEVIQGSRLMRKIMQAPALKGITVAEVLPGPLVESDEQMLQYFRENSGSIYHLCGSCPWARTSRDRWWTSG